MADLAHLPTNNFPPIPIAYSPAAFIQLPAPTKHSDIVDDGVLGLHDRMILGALKGIGKTVALTQITYEIASAKHFLGIYRVQEPRKVMLIQKEIDDEKFKQRLSQLEQKYIYDPNYVLTFKREQIQDIRLDTQRGVMILRQMIAFYHPDVVVLDPISEFYSIDDDKAHLVSIITDNINKLMFEFGCAFIISHHFKKPFQDNRGRRMDQGMQDFRGSGHWVNWADSVLWMNDRGHGKVIMDSFFRNGEADPPTINLTLNRKYVSFDAEIQDSPTTAGQFAVVQIMNQIPGLECSYDDLHYRLVQRKVGPRQAHAVIGEMVSKKLLYTVGNNSNTRVRLLSKQAKGWIK